MGLYFRWDKNVETILQRNWISDHGQYGGEKKQSRRYTETAQAISYKEKEERLFWESGIYEGTLVKWQDEDNRSLGIKLIWQGALGRGNIA